MDELSKDIFEQGGVDTGVTSLVEKWTEFELNSLKRSLQDDASKVADFKQAAVFARKHLSEATKVFKNLEEFKTATGSSVLKSHLPKLLRSYQEEVDRLTQRSKFSEKVVLDLFRRIKELPNPLEQLSAADKEIFSLDGTLKQLKVRMGEKDLTIQKLEADLNAKLVELEQVKTDTSTELVQVELERRLAAEKDKTKAYVQQLSEAHENEIGKLAAEMDLQQQENDKLMSSVEELEANLKLSLDPGSNGQQSLKEFEKLEAANVTLTIEKSKIENEVLVLKQYISSLEEKEQAAANVESDDMLRLKAALATKDEEIIALQETIESMPAEDTFVKLRTQVGLLQTAMDPDRSVKSLGITIPEVDARLLEINDGLKEEVKKKDSQLASKGEEIEKVRAAELILHDRLEEERKLVRNLENELFQVSSISKNGSFAIRTNMHQMSQSIPKSQQTEASESGGKAGVSPQQGYQPENHNEAALKNMLSAVSAQRDRLRVSVQEFEERMEQVEIQLRQEKQNTTSLKEDNQKLYQRIRFLESYKQSERSTLFAEAGSSETSNVVLDVNREPQLLTNRANRGLGRGVQHKFRQFYEAGDAAPWNGLPSTQRRRLQNNAPLAEQLSMKLFEPFLENRQGRVCLTYYTLAVHFCLLVFLFKFII